MSTTDVPGYRKRNHDELHVGCWGEHEDGSMIFVEGFEDGNVIYSVFDPDKGVEYRDMMTKEFFEKKFTFDGRGDLWTWHDKTPFPWQNLSSQFKHGEKDITAMQTISAAERVAESLSLRAKEIRDVQTISGKGIMSKLRRAMARLN
jgi:hypothetical protein